MKIAEKRWIKTDKLLKAFQREVGAISKDTRIELEDFLNSLDITLEDLSKPISSYELAKMDKAIRDNSSIVAKNKYLDYLIKTKRRRPLYSEYIMIMLLLIYTVMADKEYKKSKILFLLIAQDAYEQAEEEVGRPPVTPFEITWRFVEGLLVVNTFHVPLLAYLMALTQTDADEAYKLYLQFLQAPRQTKTAQSELLANMLEKQQNRLVNIHGDKESGMYVDLARETWHKVYIEPYKEENLQCRFIAEIDKVTTPMCRGMDNMLFYVNDWNRYYRWSDMDKKDVLYTTWGLQVGENLPPINNHFHWCRSTITYQVDE